jgi:hypothetical protein
VRGLTIGGATVSVASLRGRRPWEVDRLHRPFVGASGSPRLELRVRPLAGAPPDPGVLRFDSGTGWQVGRTPGGWSCLFWHTHGRRPQLAQALVADRRWRRATLWVPSEDAPFFLAYPLEPFLFLNVLARSAALVVHAAGIVREGRAWLFTGPHGAGKSTIATLLGRDRRTTLLSDDRVIVRRVGGRWQAFGTPWSGTVRRATSPAAAPVAALCFIRHGPATRAEPLAAGVAARRLVPRCLQPFWDRPAIAALLAAAEDFAAAVPAFDLPFVPEAVALDRVLGAIPPTRGRPHGGS